MQLKLSGLSVKQQRVVAWVMSDGERYYSRGDVDNTAGQVYPFGPDMKELFM